MKKSYKRLIIFQFIMFFLLILNSFISNILSEYNIVLFLVILLITFKFVLGFEKDNHRYTKDVIYDIVIFSIIFLIAYYVLGIFIGFAKSDNYYSWIGLKSFILPVVFSIILKEFLRYMMLKKSEKSKLLVITTCILFILLDVTNAIYYNSFDTSYNTFIFFALTLFPAISSNIMCTYLSLKSGYRPTIIYLLIIGLYPYLLPIVPNPSEYISSIVQLVVPIVLFYRLYQFFKKTNDEYVSREYNKKDWLLPIIPLIVIVVSVYFTSGYFHYQAVAIATGSMHPNIKKGDVAIIEKIDDGYDKLKEGQVIAFKYNGVVIIHRIIRIVKQNNSYYFYTKGDANNGEDGYPVTVDMIVGKVSTKIPFIGLPTVWLKEL